MKETQEQGFGDKEQYVSFSSISNLDVIIISTVAICKFQLNFEIKFYILLAPSSISDTLFNHQGAFVAAKDCFRCVSFNFSCIGSVETWLVHGPT